MTGHILNLCTHLPLFIDYEKTVIRRLYATLHPQNNTPSPLSSTTPTVLGNQPSTLVNPNPSLPICQIAQPLQIPPIPLPIQNTPFPPVPENSTWGGGYSWKQE